MWHHQRVPVRRGRGDQPQPVRSRRRATTGPACVHQPAARAQHRSDGDRAAGRDGRGSVLAARDIPRTSSVNANDRRHRSWRGSDLGCERLLPLQAQLLRLPEPRCSQRRATISKVQVGPRSRRHGHVIPSLPGATSGGHPARGDDRRSRSRRCQRAVERPAAGSSPPARTRTAPVARSRSGTTRTIRRGCEPQLHVAPANIDTDAQDDRVGRRGDRRSAGRDRQPRPRRPPSSSHDHLHERAHDRMADDLGITDFGSRLVGDLHPGGGWSTLATIAVQRLRLGVQARPPGAQVSETVGVSRHDAWADR